MAITIGNKRTGVAFSAIVDRVGRDDLSEILLNWNDSELSDDGEKIIQYIGRDREYSKGAVGGKATISKKEFLAWLLSDAPFDEKVYGEGIRKDVDWARKIELARQASGLYLNNLTANNSQADLRSS